MAAMLDMGFRFTSSQQLWEFLTPELTSASNLASITTNGFSTPRGTIALSTLYQHLV